MTPNVDCHRVGQCPNYRYEVGTRAKRKPNLRFMKIPLDNKPGIPSPIYSGLRGLCRWF